MSKNYTCLRELLPHDIRRAVCASGKEETGNKRNPLSTQPVSSRETLEERMIPLLRTTC